MILVSGHDLTGLIPEKCGCHEFITKDKIDFAYSGQPPHSPC